MKLDNAWLCCDVADGNSECTWQNRALWDDVSAMKEIYSWVPWFAELSRKIAAGGEEYLVDQAKRIPWKDEGTAPSLLKYTEENIDPFSFVYTLAGFHHARKRIYSSVSEAFNLTSELPLNNDEAFVFPTPQLINVLYHDDGVWVTLLFYGACSEALSRALTRFLLWNSNQRSKSSASP